MKWTLVAVIAIIVGMIIVVCIKLYRWWVVKPCHPKSCLDVPPEETIFVSLIALPNTCIVQLLRDLYALAYCPSRVHIGVLHIKGAEDTLRQYKNHRDEPWYRTGARTYHDRNHPLEQYKRQTKHWKYNYSDQIRIISTLEDDGPCHARALVESKLYQQQKFYLILHHACKVVKHWDRQLVQEWEQCCARAGHQRCIMTAPLSHRRERHHTLWPVFKSWSERTGYPQFAYAQFANTPNRHYRSMAWCRDVAFALGSVIRDAPHMPWLYHLNDGYDFFMTIYYTLHHYELYTLTRPIGYCNPLGMCVDHEEPNGEDARTRCYHSYVNLQNWYRAVEESMRVMYCVHYPIDIFHCTVDAKAQLGIPQQVEADEILCKFGSLQDFQHTLSRIKHNDDGDGGGSGTVTTTTTIT